MHPQMLVQDRIRICKTSSKRRQQYGCQLLNKRPIIAGLSRTIYVEASVEEFFSRLYIIIHHTFPHIVGWAGVKAWSEDMGDTFEGKSQEQKQEQA